VQKAAIECGFCGVFVIWFSTIKTVRADQFCMGRHQDVWRQLGFTRGARKAEKKKLKKQPKQEKIQTRFKGMVRFWVIVGWGFQFSGSGWFPVFLKKQKLPETIPTLFTRSNPPSPDNYFRYFHFFLGGGKHLPGEGAGNKKKKTFLVITKSLVG